MRESEELDLAALTSGMEGIADSVLFATVGVQRPP